MSTGKLILGIGVLAFVGYSLYNKNSTTNGSGTDRLKTVKDFFSGEDPTQLQKFDQMSQDELQLVIDLLVKPIYSVPLPPDVQAKFNSLSQKYNIFT